MRAIALTIAAVLSALAFASQAQNSLNPNQVDAGVATYGLPLPNAASDVWHQEADGSVTHIQSGLSCPTTFPGVALWRMSVYPSPLGRGMDASCDYGGDLDSNTSRWHAKLTIYATRVDNLKTLDDMFEQYRDEVHSTYDGVRDLGPLPERSDDPGGVTLPEYRSETFSFSLGGESLYSELIAAKVDVWVIEVRSTYPPPPDTPTGPYVGNARAALIRAATTIGRSI